MHWYSGKEATHQLGTVVLKMSLFGPVLPVHVCVLRIIVMKLNYQFVHEYNLYHTVLVTLLNVNMYFKKSVKKFQFSRK